MKAKRYIILAILLSIVVPTLNISGTSQAMSDRSSHRFRALSALRMDKIANLTVVEPETFGYRDTTNPYKNWTGGDPLNELTVSEAYEWKRMDVVLVLDEEAIDRWGIDYSVRAVERADEALVHNYNLDLKISQIITYESDDSIIWMNPDAAPSGEPTLYEEAFNLLKSYFDGETEIIIAVTGQETIDSYYAGLAPTNPMLRINTMVMARFQVYWADDNLIQHEVSHCFGCNDHPKEVDVWCVMAYKTELLYIDWIVEDGNWFGPYNSNVARSYLTYDYCSECDQKIIWVDAGHYFGGNPLRPWPIPL